MLLIKKESVKLKDFNTVNFSLIVIKSPIDGLCNKLRCDAASIAFPRPLRPRTAAASQRWEDECLGLPGALKFLGRS